MQIEELQDFKFYVSLGYVVIISSILTIITMNVYKNILKRKKIITTDMDKDKKDNILSKAGRIIALVIYSMIYLINEYYTKNRMIIDEGLMIGLLSGSATTLAVAKGMYTSLRQHQKKKHVYERLLNAEQTIEKLQEQAVIRQSRIILKGKEEN